MRPNIFLGTCEGSTQYKKWYFEVMVDQVEPFLTAQPYHLRVGWALTEGYSPYPGGGEGWGGNGVGDDLYSYGFDGLHLWSGKVKKDICIYILHCLLHAFCYMMPTRYTEKLCNILLYIDKHKLICSMCPQDVFHVMLHHLISTCWQQRTWSAAVWI